MFDRKITLFDAPSPHALAGTTHIEVSVSHHGGAYSLNVSPYSLPLADDAGLRSYPLYHMRSARLQEGRFNAKTLANLAAKAETRTLATTLSGVSCT